MEQKVIALAGNPNTGKSTVFNAFTGLKQHTGNWAGKTVATAKGTMLLCNEKVELVDLPGVYSLFSDQAEESCARNFLALEQPDGVLAILDATCLERNLPLVLQLMELNQHIVVCLNLWDEAQKKGITIDVEKLETLLGVPVVKTAARSKEGLEDARKMLCKAVYMKQEPIRTAFHDDFSETFGYLAESLQEFAQEQEQNGLFLDMVLEREQKLWDMLQEKGYDTWQLQELDLRREAALTLLEQECGSLQAYQKRRSLAFQNRATEIANAVYQKQKKPKAELFDKLMLNKKTGVPLMLLLLGVVFWITVAGANVPSNMLMEGFQSLGVPVRDFVHGLGVPVWLESLLMDGVYLTVSWVVSVMLPPMAIFFPLFTLLEDFGLLPRIAFQMDGLFQKAGASGKQALTLSMGFGCNAAGVTSCCIIHSPRERMIAILTNNFVPCNGRFPTIILLSSIFLSAGMSWLSGFAVFIVIGLSVGLTLLVSFLLSHTLLKGLPSSFVLELPPYRKPKIGQVLVRSLLDRTLFVLGRAVTVAIPAGAVIWVFQNVSVGDGTILQMLADFLEPLGSLMGLSGVILAAFLLGMPANEIVLPVLLMFYSQSGMLVEADGMAQAGQMLAMNGWTWTTAVCAILFVLNHFPCATTLLTIKKETGSWKWTAVSFLLPTVVGIVVCSLANGIFMLLGLA